MMRLFLYNYNKTQKSMALYLVFDTTKNRECMRGMFYNIIMDDNKKSKTGRARGEEVEKNMQEIKTLFHFSKWGNF